MKVLVTGVNGQLGHDVVNELAHRKISVIGSDITADYHGIQDHTSVCDAPYVQMDITDFKIVENVLLSVRPDVIIHCAAWTAVDLAEEESNQEKVFLINAKGTEYIARLCKILNAKMLYLSTDYVFNGEGEKPWSAECQDFKPLNIYGQSKLDGELAVQNLLEKYFIVRIAWVFGLNGNNFIKTMLKLGKKYSTIRVVCDQIGTPTYTLDLAVLLADMILSEQYGVYHVTNEGGYISWYDLSCEIFKQAQELGHSDYKNVELVPVTTEEYGLSKARRPYNSRLDKSKLEKKGFKPLPDWKDALRRFLKEMEF